MNPRTLQERATAMLERLDARLERQTFEPGADAPHVVSLVGLFHREAGNVERRMERMPLDRFGILTSLRILRRIVSTHAILVRHRAMVVRTQKGRA